MERWEPKSNKSQATEFKKGKAGAMNVTCVVKSVGPAGIQRTPTEL